MLFSDDNAFHMEIPKELKISCIFSRPPTLEIVKQIVIDSDGKS